MKVTRMKMRDSMKVKSMRMKVSDLMKVKVMKITVVDERGTSDQRRDAAAAAEVEFTILQPITHQHAGILQKKLLISKLPASVHKSSKVQNFLPSASRRKSSEPVLL